MKLYLDTTNGRLVTSITDATPLGSLPVHQGDIGSVQLVLLAETGTIAAPYSVIDLPAAYASMTLGARLASDLMQEELLFSATDWVASGSGASRVYTADLNRETSGIADAFPDENLTLRSVDALLDIQWTSADESEKATPLRQWPVTITRDLVRDTEGVPTSGNPMLRAIWMPTITGMTGGGATKLDGLATVEMSDLALAAIAYPEAGDYMSFWTLTPTVAPADEEDQIVPDDFDEDTNERAWKLSSLRVSTLDAYTEVIAPTVRCETLLLIGGGAASAQFDPTSLSAHHTYTLPNQSGVMVLATATQTLTGKTLSGASNTIINVSLTAGVTGCLPVANGGTGATSLIDRAFSPTVLAINDDFCFGDNADGKIGTGWRVYHLVGTGSTAGLASSAAGSGLCNITSGATAGNATIITMGLSGGTSVFAPCASGFNMAIKCALSSATSVACLWGITGDGSGISVNATIANGIYIRANTATDTNFTFCCTSGGATTATASSVALDTAQHVFRARRVSASSVAFSIDGGAETTIASNVPTGAMSPRFQAGTLTSAARAITADYFKLAMLLG